VNILERILDTTGIIKIHTELLPKISHYSTLLIYKNANRLPGHHIKHYKLWKCMGHYSTAYQNKLGAKMSYLSLIATKLCRLSGFH
jgi:hypothetical protein